MNNHIGHLVVGVVVAVQNALEEFELHQKHRKHIGTV